MPVLLSVASLSGGCVATGEEEAAETQLAKRNDVGVEVERAYRYLDAYGYLVDGQLPGNPQKFDAQLEQALVLFQELHGLPADGKLNAETLKLMAQPRCSAPDHAMIRAKLGGPSASYSLQSRWPTNHITYSHGSFSPDLPSSTVEDAMTAAAAQWAGANPALTFARQPSVGYIEIDFKTGDHGDGLPFGPPSQVIAHAFAPGMGSLSGDIHFDDDKIWNANGIGGYNIYTVMLHELGHALGLNHTNVAGSVMLAGYPIAANLGTDDINGIRANYAPHVPASITGYNEACYGDNSVFWPESAGATRYELYRSFSPSFTNSVLIENAPGPSAFVQVGPGQIWYLRVKACNSMVCSDMSTAQTSATYFNGCP